MSLPPALFALVIAATLVLAGVALAALVLLWGGARDQRQAIRRFQGDGAEAAEAVEGAGVLLEGMARGGEKLEDLIDTREESPQLLMRAGWRSPRARQLYYLAHVIAPVLLAILTGFLLALLPERARFGPLPLLYLVGAVLLGILLPRLLLRAAASERQRRVHGEVPLFIHLLVLLFEAGLSTRQAIASLVREGRGVLPELGREFEIVLKSLEAGGDTAEVLKKLGDMLDVPDLTGVLAILRQVDRYGGEVREPLLETLSVMEERRQLTLREKVNLMSGRMTVVMVAFFFPALLIFVAGPAFVSIIAALADVNSGAR
ncbi:MAG TPA: type II secretion system F family protein [Nevskiaceae bacterium]|nr:type II secretion system F family protein [Nevskiaceae bacterium]